MKTKLNIEELENKIDFENLSNRLLELSETGKLKRRKTIADLLDKIRPALQQARERKVSFASLTQFLAESGIPVSEPTLRQYLRSSVKIKARKKSKMALSLEQETQKIPVESSLRKQPPRLARKT